MCPVIEIPFFFKICANNFLILSLGVLLTVILYKTKNKMTCTKPAKQIKLDYCRKRVLTDLPFLVSFGTFIIVWIGTSIYAYYYGNSEMTYHFILHCANILKDSCNEFVYSVYQKLIDSKRCFRPDCLFENHLRTVVPYEHGKKMHSRFILLWCIILCCTVLTTFVALLRWATKLLVWIIIVITSILLFLTYCVIGYCIYQKFIGFIAILPLIIVSLVYGSIINAYTKVDFKICYDIIHESCKAALFFFSSLLFYMLIQFTLQSLVVIFSVSVYFQLSYIAVSKMKRKFHQMNMDIEPDLIDISVPYHIYIFLVINICGCLWVNCFIMKMGRMILTSAFANWWLIRDKHSMDEMSTPSLSQCGYAIIRYHLGTIAYASSIFSVIPMFYIIWKFGRDGLKRACKQPTLIFSWLAILMTFSSNALTMSAISGNKFYKSAKDSYILSMKFPLLFLTITTITEYVIFIGMFFVVTTPYFVSLAIFKMQDGATLSYVKTDALTDSSFIFLVISIMFFAVFRAASSAVCFCYLRKSDLQRNSIDEVHVNDMVRIVNIS